MHALGGFRPHGHVRVCATARNIIAGTVSPPHTGTVTTMRAGSQVRFHPDNGFHIVSFCLPPEVEGAE